MKIFPSIEDLLEKGMKLEGFDHMVETIMSQLQLGALDMFFVAYTLPDSEDYEVVGVAYAIDAARAIKKENKEHPNLRIYRFNMGKLLKIVESFGALEEVL